MKITGVETLRLPDLPNVLLVQVHSDAGIIGLGETYYGAAAVEVHIHEALAPALVGRMAPRSTEDIAELLRPAVGYVGYLGTGVEVRARSAIDLALWDLLGRVTATSISGLLGGRLRPAVPMYNTCAGPHYMRQPGGQRFANWGLPQSSGQGRYEDLHAFLHHADRLAEDLLLDGIRAMKIWPFDPYAEASHGQVITADELSAGLEPMRKIRSAVADDMQILVEMHGLWEPSAAQRIMAALAEFSPTWVEDPIRPDRYQDMQALHDMNIVHIAAGETLGGAAASAPLLAGPAVDTLIADLAWCGGITEARVLAAQSADASVGFALHDCSGPVVLAASTHLAVSYPHVMMQEATRAYYHSWYPQLVDGLPEIQDGYLVPSERPGHGVELCADLLLRAGLARRITGTGNAAVPKSDGRSARALSPTAP